MKKQERLANKKRKTAALANIIEINDNDKKSKKSQQSAESDSSTSVEKIISITETVSWKNFSIHQVFKAFGF